MTSGLRITLSKTELQALLTLARYGADQIAAASHYYIVPKRQEAVAADVIQGLERGLASVQWKQAEARARREAPKREAERRAAREHHAVVDGYTRLGHILATGPTETEPRPQGEIRRDVWRIFITRGSSTWDDFTVRAIAPSQLIAGKSNNSRAGSSPNTKNDDPASAIFVDCPAIYSWTFRYGQSI